MSRILLIDGNTLLTGLLTGYLTVEGLDIHSVSDGEAGAQEILAGQYDVVVLDSMIPKMNGLDVLRSIYIRSTVLIIMPAAGGDDIDHIIGLEMGMNDYVPKSCTPHELLARVNAILCHTQYSNEQNNTPNNIFVSDVVLYPTKRQVSIKDTLPELTSTEFNLLEVLMHHTGQVISREALSVEALNHKLVKSDRSINVCISSTRHKLSDASPAQAVHNLDYLFVKN